MHHRNIPQQRSLSSADLVEGYITVGPINEHSSHAHTTQSLLRSSTSQLSSIDPQSKYYHTVGGKDRPGTPVPNTQAGAYGGKDLNMGRSRNNKHKRKIHISKSGDKREVFKNVTKETYA